MSYIWRLCLLFACMGPWAHAQSSADLKDLLSRYRYARADMAAYIGTRSIRAEGVTEQGGKAYPFELNQKESGEIRLETKVGDETIIQIDDGQDAWLWVAENKSKGLRQMNEAQQRFFRLNYGFHSPLDAPAEFDFNLRYLGVVTVHETPEHHVRLTSSRHDDIIDIWIDANTFLENRRDYRPNVAATALSTTFKDYRKIDGIMVPFLVETQFQGKSLSKTTLKVAQRNHGMLSFYFKKPSGYEIVTEPEVVHTAAD